MGEGSGLMNGESTLRERPPLKGQKGVERAHGLLRVFGREKYILAEVSVRDSS